MSTPTTIRALAVEPLDIPLHTPFGIAGGITPGNATGQEGKLRTVAVVLEKQPFGKLAIVACDVLMITRQHLDPVVAEVEKSTGIPAANLLINCTHTHHAPSTMIVHGYGLDDTFTRRV